MGKEAHIAVFGDTHGHLRLCLQLCRLWQMEMGVHLDGVLQCGDFGYFPDVTRLDKATKRYAKKDPEELGFPRYFGRPEPEKRDVLVEKILMGSEESLETLRAPFYWCNGNHEDFVALAELLEGAGEKSAVAVDFYECLFYVPSGNVVELQLDKVGRTLRVGALGGGPGAVDDVGPKFVCPLAGAKLEDENFHVLLSHCGPAGGDFYGSSEIKSVVQRVQPAFNFFAHYERKIAPFMVGDSQCFWLSDVKFDRETNGLEEGCMGILKVTEDGMAFSLVEEPWVLKVRASSWRYL